MTRNFPRLFLQGKSLSAPKKKQIGLGLKAGVAAISRY